MPGVQFQIDPVADDATNAPLDVADGSTYVLLSEKWAAPELDAQYASSVDTDGDPLVEQRYRNTRDTIELRVYGGVSYQGLQTAIFALQQKADKIKREGGTIRRTAPSGAVAYRDVVAMRVTPAYEKGALVSFRDTVTLELECRPGWRGAEQACPLRTETTLPCLVFTETAIKGDMPARGRLVITDAQGADQAWAIWGVQSRRYSSAATAALFYEAETRTLLGGASLVTATGPAASGGATNNIVRSGALTDKDTSVLSTQATGGGAHLSHAGSFRVFARMRLPALLNTYTAAVHLDWSTGDFRRVTSNAETRMTGIFDDWWLVDLGTITVPASPKGTPRWEGRVRARTLRPAYSTATGRLEIDCLMFIPVDEGSAEIRGGFTPAAPVDIQASDPLASTSGALNARAAEKGGSWATSGATTDFAGTTDWAGGPAFARSTGSDASKRVALLGTSSYTDVEVAAELAMGGTYVTMGTQGVVARYVDASNYVYASASEGLNVTVFAGGTGVGGAFATFKRSDGGANSYQGYLRTRLFVYASGRFVAQAVDASTGQVLATVSGWHSALATGGALATGKAGLIDSNANAAGWVRYYRNFYVSNTVPDAAIFAGRQLEVRADSALRQDTAGSVWVEPTAYEGDYLAVPPAGREGRSARFIVKASRNQPGSMPDTAIDDLSAQLFYTPRYLALPE